ncbi:D-beta-hydroxybutyrate dehydrogenase, mitochondrial-like isoform X2 [Dermacentor albipictus]|uniref:D-beta-hydroxybutyrate dehydrogenase, mitochondrial-like isoform X2 n=1 Tax=Dermacentor albipictus TaxID=60249 RepID=UPI0038FBF02D
MRTSWVLFSVFLWVFWRLWDALVPLHVVGTVLGCAWLIGALSYVLSHLFWKYVFVTSVSSDGKAVVITGCDTGFGHRLTKRLSRDGFLVFAGCLSSTSDGAKQLRASSNVEVLQLDVTKQEQVDDALHAVKKHLGARELWSVVANAGVLRSGLLEWLSMDTIVDVFDVNVFGVLRVTKTFLPLLKRSKGRVVTVASPLAMFTMISTTNAIMREFEKQPAEVVADYSLEEVEQWTGTTGGIFDAGVREDLEEAVDLIEKAVRETYPKARYRSPWSLGRLYVSCMSSLPSEAADVIVHITRQVQLRRKWKNAGRFKL